jgi:ATP-binding cassette subfamily B protein
VTFVRRALSSFEHVPRTLALVARSSRAMTAVLAVATLLGAVLPLGVAWAGKGIVDAVVAHDGTRTLRWVLAELALVALVAAASQGQGLLRSVLGARLSLDVNVAILEKARTLELRHFEDSELYDRLTKARREASVRPLAMVMRTFSLVQSTITVVGYAALLLRYGAWAVVVLALAAIPATVAEMRFSNQAFRMRNWRSPDSRKLIYLEYALANDEHAKEMRLFGLGPLFLGRYKSLGEGFYEEDKKLATKRAWWAWVLSLLATGAFYGCYAAMALAAVAGSISLGEMTLYMVSFRQGQQAFQSLLSGFGGMVEDNLYMSNLFAFLDLDTSAGKPAPSSAPKSDALRSERGVRFEDVGFRYDGTERWALRHVSVFIPEGQSLALVGKNGAGKTTFIKLMTRLYDPTEGRVLLDGKDLRDWDEDALRARIGVVFQDFNQYQLSLRENVGVGDVAAMDDAPRVGRAIDKGGAEEVVAQAKGGLDAQLGRWFKDGVELSGGQWQKIALSRAFMREGADILVLDEPTAALDAEAEHAVFERFRALTKGKTSLLISHRFPTVRMADRILVVEGGEIVEEGTHAELVAQGGRYAKMFALQAQGYLDEPAEPARAPSAA